jgi:hypothetical protein
MLSFFDMHEKSGARIAQCSCSRNSSIWGMFALISNRYGHKTGNGYDGASALSPQRVAGSKSHQLARTN